MEEFKDTEGDIIQVSASYGAGGSVYFVVKVPERTDGEVEFLFTSNEALKMAMKIIEICNEAPTK